jgi:hypothetical protein
MELHIKMNVTYMHITVKANFIGEERTNSLYLLIAVLTVQTGYTVKVHRISPLKLNLSWSSSKLFGGEKLSDLAFLERAP